MLKYNYVIIGDDSWSEVFFHDLVSNSQVKYYKSICGDVKNTGLKKIVLAAFSPRRSHFVHFIATCIVAKWLFKFDFNNPMPVCYILLDKHHLIYNNNFFMHFLKKRKNCKGVVLYLIDLVSRNNNLTIEHAKKTFNYIFSYDQKDCELYKLRYVPTPFSKIPMPEINRTLVDVYFCGYAKNRMAEIKKFYYEIKKYGLSCSFFIKDCPLDERIESDEIHYDVNLSYKDNLSHACRARCILEIMQKNADGFTPRLWEAITYDKVLLSNNRNILTTPYYYEKGCIFFEDISQLPKLLQTELVYPEEFKRRLSPNNFIEKVDSIIL